MKTIKDKGIYLKPQIEKKKININFFNSKRAIDASVSYYNGGPLSCSCCNVFSCCSMGG